MFVCANTFSGDLGLDCKFEENKTILKTDNRTMEFRSSEFKPRGLSRSMLLFTKH